MYHNKINIPDGDILIHAGDFLNHGSMSEFVKFARNMEYISKKFKNVVMTAGNHDRIVEKDEYLCKDILKETANNIHLLIDEEIILNGLKFYGSPRTIEFFNWAFMYPPGQGSRYWNNIPDDTDILITHQPVLNKLDYIERVNADRNHNVGCGELLKRVLEVKPILHVVGHLHYEGCKYIKEENAIYVNASMCDEEYKINRKPIVVDINVKTKSIKMVGV